MRKHSRGGPPCSGLDMTGCGASALPRSAVCKKDSCELSRAVVFFLGGEGPRRGACAMSECHKSGGGVEQVGRDLQSALGLGSAPTTIEECEQALKAATEDHIKLYVNSSWTIGEFGADQMEAIARRKACSPELRRRAQFIADKIRLYQTTGRQFG